MEVRSIRPEETEVYLDTLAEAFPKAPRELFRRYIGGDPWFKPEHSRIVEDNGKVVSIVQICRREVRFGASTLVMGGIANVGTPREFQHKGYSSKAMCDAVRVMIEEEMDFSMLLTGINEYYERFRYATVDIANEIYRIDRLTPPYSSYTVRPYTADDAAAVIDMYNQTYSDVTLSAIRTKEYWMDFVMKSYSTRHSVWIAEKTDGNIAAYLAGINHGSAYSIAEMGCTDGNETAFPSLMNAAVAEAKELELESIAVVPTNKQEVLTAVREIGTHVETQLGTHSMFRVLNLNQMVTKMLPEMSRRAAKLGAQGSVTLSTPHGELNLSAGTGGVTLQDQPGSSRLELNEKQLCELLLGYSPASEMFPEHPARSLLSALFPKVYPAFSMMDGF